jgi:hypothetical protein
VRIYMHETIWYQTYVQLDMKTDMLEDRVWGREVDESDMFVSV